MFNGSTEYLDQYLTETLLSPTPIHSNPSDHIISLVNTEFYDQPIGGPTASEHLEMVAQNWIAQSSQAAPLDHTFNSSTNEKKSSHNFSSALYKTGVLIERNFTNYRRNLLAYGIRSKYSVSENQRRQSS